MSSSVTEILARRISIAFVIACSTMGARASQNNSAQPVEFSRLANAPLYFESNAGQYEGSAQFIARGNDCTVMLAPTQAQILLGKSSDQMVPPRSVFLQLSGANSSASISGRDLTPARANYFIGNEPSRWHSGVPLFSKVRVDEVYPGVQVIYYANQSAQLEYDFLLQPGAATDQIRFRITGADSVQVDAAGNLVLKLGSEEIRQHKPVAYQEIRGARSQVLAAYRLNTDGTIGFALGDYDRTSLLTIDPVLDFLTYIGGKKVEFGHSIALDGDGNIYVAGETLSTDLGATNVLGTTNNIAFTNDISSLTNFSRFRGGNNAFGDAFVAKYDNSGALQFLTYLGGKRDDGALGIAYDAVGNAIWVTGFTDSTNFPLVNPIRSKLTGQTKNALHIPPVDAFISKLDLAGTNLLFSTYFGGDSIDEAMAIATDLMGGIYVTGLTSSTNLLTAVNAPVDAYQPKIAGQFDAFVTKLSGSGSTYNVVYATYLGGTNVDYGLSIAVDSSTDAWVTGLTLSTNFPCTNALSLPPDPNNFFFPNGYTFTNLNTETNVQKGKFASLNSDAFVTELNPAGTLVPFSTYLGGSNEDVGQQIVIKSDVVYVTGFTSSQNFPTNQMTATPTNFAPPVTNEVVFTSPGTNFVSHVFVTKIKIANQALDRSTAFGGNLSDKGRGIAVDDNGLVYVTGALSSTNFFQRPLLVTNKMTEIKHQVMVTNYFGIVTNSPVFTDLSSTNVTVRFKHGGNTNDVFVAVLSSDLDYFTNTISLGGPGRDDAEGIVVSPDGHVVYLVGTTTSPTNFTFNAAQPLFNGNGKSGHLSDAFVGKIQIVPVP
jgi:beta-propeller repeat-containing protein